MNRMRGAAPALDQSARRWFSLLMGMLLVGGLAVVAAPASRAAHAGNGFTLFGDSSRRDLPTYTVKLTNSNLEPLRSHFQFAVDQIHANTATRLSIAPGIHPVTEPSRGEIVVYGSLAGAPCGGGDGCAGPRTLASEGGYTYITASRMWLNVSGILEENSVSFTRSMVGHELGHALGLDHHDDGVVLMDSRVSSADLGTYKAGDLRGLQYLASNTPAPHDSGGSTSSGSTIPTGQSWHVTFVGSDAKLRISHHWQTGWQHDNFQLPVRAGSSPSAFRGSDGKLFIAWTGTDNALRLSHWTGSTWQHDNFGLRVAAGSNPSAFLGRYSTPFISWVDDSNALRLSHWTANGWQNDNFGMKVRSGSTPSAFLGGGENPFISFVGSDGYLRLSHWVGTKWQHDNFGLSVRPGTSPDGFRSHADAPVVSWVDADGRLRLSHWTANGWQNDNFGMVTAASSSPSAFG